MNVGFSLSGLTLGGDWAASKSNATLYTSAEITAAGDLVAVSGRDATFAGAHVQGENVYVDAGRDLSVISRQDVSTNNSKGFNFSVTIGPTGVPTALGAGFSYGEGSRRYTEDVTSLIANNVLDIFLRCRFTSSRDRSSGDRSAYTGNTTYLVVPKARTH